MANIQFIAGFDSSNAQFIPAFTYLKQGPDYQITYLPDGRLLVTQLGAVASSDVLEWDDEFASGTTTSAAISGTITTATESDIVSGGKTIIITLTNDTWDTTIGANNAITSALIAGIDSAQSEATGWDAVVKANMDYNDVVRTSDTVVTITLGAESTYSITADETITVTIPASALVTSTSDVVASPTFNITSESGLVIPIFMSNYLRQMGA